MKMNRLAYCILSLAAFVMPACSDDDKLPDVAPTGRGTVTDNMGNEYEWVRIGDQLWTTTNALNGLPVTEAEYYNNFDWEYVISDVEWAEEEYMPVYGNIMTYEEAVASAPEGWRLPSDEDWKRLERTLGVADVDSKGWRGAGVGDRLKEVGSGCGLGLLLGGGTVPMKEYGWINLSLSFVGEYGFYWTSTVDSSYQTEYEMAYFRKIAAGVDKIGRECGRTDQFCSVRWVKDAE